MTDVKDARRRGIELTELCIGKSSCYKSWVLAQFSLKRHFESSREKGAETGGRVLELRIQSAWSFPGWWTFGQMR